ncbi:MAG: radical SAM protein [Candidatus Cloacimonetes bacterium]|nr:radical SAM protein [Candidatus Cloacimonadota bacterium]
MIDLSEIFCSIQGESTFAGLPCIFIRLAGCNLRCSYCDTFYSYEKAFSLSTEDIVEKISEFRPINLVEITGGEPLLQTEIYRLFDLLNKQGYKILLETNGSISLEKVPFFVTKIVDVKCPGSGCKDPFLLTNIQFLTLQDELKFVLSNYEDYIFAKEFLAENSISNLPILFSPVPDRLQPHLLANWILKDRLPVRLQLQLHKYIWHGEEAK